ncbi:unnamed protein product [Toxocara canis]|uniref:Core-binding (CB) domain-containing protein n=1 Tax=Toxocara canis TaxID=6265 RepID=A0A183V933_TOXCA|nr:unnamed protein product [Toxocara canis]
MILGRGLQELTDRIGDFLDIENRTRVTFKAFRGRIAMMKWQRQHGDLARLTGENVWHRFAATPTAMQSALTFNGLQSFLGLFDACVPLGPQVFLDR